MNGAQRSDYFLPFPEVRLEVDGRDGLAITAAVTNGQTIHTNDRVELRADGAFRWLGRLDNVINSGGVKVQVEKVEAAMEAWLLHYHDGRYAARRFFVGALDEARLGQTVVAVIEGEPFAGGSALAPALRADLQHTLSCYEVPRHFFFMPTLLETPTGGKIDRRATLACLAAQRGL
jgi:O-succinylbenzoic acid--CoA ligase